MIGADALLEALKSEGVQQIFGYPGGAVLPLYDRLPFHDIPHILVRHEQGAGFAAQGYARITGEVGVCLATSGPGATNLVTSIADAKLDSIPMIAITGNVFRHLIGSDAFQEVDTVGIVEPIVKHAFFVDNADDITAVVHAAFALARSGRPGPVLIDITKNAQADEVKDTEARSSHCEGKGESEGNEERNHPGVRSNPCSTIQDHGSPHSAVASFAMTGNGNLIQEAMISSLRPVVIYGHGVTLGNAHTELEEFLEKSGIPAVWTFLGIGGVDETKSGRYGMLGMHGTMAANYAVHNADLIIGIGIRFDDRIYGKLTEFQKDKHIIHFDIDPSEFGKNVKNYASIVGNVKETLPLFTEIFSPQEEQQKDWDNWNTQIQGVDTENPLEKNDGLCHCEERSNPCSTCSRFTQVSVIDMLYELKGERDVVIVDVGQHQMWSAQRFRSTHPRTFHGSGGLGTMGFSLPTAIGACYGVDPTLASDISSLQNTKIPKFQNSHIPTVWSISGDGGIQMNIQELGTIMAENIPVKIIILNNSFLGMVRQWQELFYKNNYVDTPMKNPDFAKVAEAYGIKGLTVRNHDEAQKALEYMKHYDGPILCNFIVENETNVYPMVPAGQSLGATMSGKE